jgi:hypothetical protein
MAVVRFDSVVTVSLGALPTIPTQLAFALRFSNGSRVAAQTVPGKHVQWPIVATLPSTVLPSAENPAFAEAIASVRHPRRQFPLKTKTFEAKRNGNPYALHSSRQRLEETPMLRDLRSNLGTAWCTLMHDSVMWPVHGQYECRTCGRHYTAFPEAPAGGWTKPAALKPVVSLLLLLTIGPAVHPSRAAEIAKEHGRTEAEAALERYIGAGSAPSWALESVEIHAALPDLTKSGRLQATRRFEPDGVRYQIVQLSGDRTVKDQVIARYLTAEERASRVPAASVAISAANYKFAYKGIVDDGERHAYVFRIAPRKKRSGLIIKGELWLDVETGLPIRRSGYLVRSPSLWIRRVAVTQEDSLSDGSVTSRLTHITAETRLVGRAELVITERPLRGKQGPQTTDAESNGGQQ